MYNVGGVVNADGIRALEFLFLSTINKRHLSPLSIILQTCGIHNVMPSLSTSLLSLLHLTLLSFSPLSLPSLLHLSPLSLSPLSSLSFTSLSSLLHLSLLSSSPLSLLSSSPLSLPSLLHLILHIPNPHSIIVFLQATQPIALPLLESWLRLHLTINPFGPHSMKTGLRDKRCPCYRSDSLGRIVTNATLAPLG